MSFSAKRFAYSDMPSFSSQSAICCVAELRCSAALGTNALLDRALASLPPTLVGFFTASTDALGTRHRSSSREHRPWGSSASVWVLNGAIF